MSAIVCVRDKDDKLIDARVLLDTCATAHLITSDFLKRLRLLIQALRTVINTVNALNTRPKGSINVRIQSKLNPKIEKSLSCLIVDEIFEIEPSEEFPARRMDIPPTVPLADPQFHVPRPVDMLIDAGTTVSLLQAGKIKLAKECELFLQKTDLGWMVVGGFRGGCKGRVASCHLTDLHRELERFWTIEESSTVPSTTEGLLCEQHYIKNFVREVDGRYVVRLPFRNRRSDLGDSRSRALRRFYSLQRRLETQPELKLKYHKIMQEYIDLKHMSLVSNESSPGYYIPHHAVFKTSSLTTKLRMVFDASMESNKGLSLNDVLMIGPTIQDRLFEQLLRFRTHVYVLTADIEKMYRQILVHRDDRDFQRIFWYHEGQIQVFELHTVTFGVALAPFLAIRSIHQLTDDEAHEFLLASKILKHDLYVDDLLTGANTLEAVLRLRDEIIDLLRRGQFNIRQWASYHHHALDNIEQKVFNVNMATTPNVVSKILGISWNSNLDEFVYTSTQIDIDVRLTKRAILSEIAKIFDPLGLLGPVTFSATVIMQGCWRLKVDWDDSVSEEVSASWSAFAQQLNATPNIGISRMLLLENPVKIEIHGFCDASKRGYGGCLYVRSSDSFNNVSVRLACFKSHVAPIKETAIPRLELCGALILVRLFKESRSAFNFQIPISRYIFWSDSTIVLKWLQKSPEVLKVFESNRVREIQSLDEAIIWRHVGAQDGPADALSRGQFPSEFSCGGAWFSGPPWLARDETNWPNTFHPLASNLPGLKRARCLMTNPVKCDFFHRFSSYAKLVSSIAFCLRMRLSNRFNGGRVSVRERVEAERRILSIIQKEQFSAEIEALKNSRTIKIAALNPFLDQYGLIRVGGRLKLSNLVESQRHPVLLPSHHHVTDLIIREAHQRILHAGIQGTLFTIRRTFWILER